MVKEVQGNKRHPFVYSAASLYGPVKCIVLQELSLFILNFYLKNFI